MTAIYTEQDQIKFLERIAEALETLAKNTAYASNPAPQAIKPAPSTHKRTASMEVFEPVKETKE